MISGEADQMAFSWALVFAHSYDICTNFAPDWYQVRTRLIPDWRQIDVRLVPDWYIAHVYKIDTHVYQIGIKFVTH